MKDIGEQVRELLPEYPHLWSRVIAWAEKERAKANRLREAAQAQVDRWYREPPQEEGGDFIAGMYYLSKVLAESK